ncbi:MAG: helix-turn-helix domain-containing protein [Planctomycetes bacterium]|nr:helix-turn-helix domain-containing protein [Planctomycetota bacterium]
MTSSIVSPGTSHIALLDVGAVAMLLGCSRRHVYRLAGASKMPRPVRVGALVRWNRAALEKWISDGCPLCGDVVTDERGVAV